METDLPVDTRCCDGGGGGAAAGVQVAAGVRVVVTSRFVTGGVFTCEDRPRIAQVGQPQVAVAVWVRVV